MQGRKGRRLAVEGEATNGGLARAAVICSGVALVLCLANLGLGALLATNYTGPERLGPSRGAAPDGADARPARPGSSRRPGGRRRPPTQGTTAAEIAGPARSSAGAAASQPLPAVRVGDDGQSARRGGRGPAGSTSPGRCS